MNVIPHLPSPLLSRLDAYALKLIMPQDMAIDFTAPPGEPALVWADSVSWLVFKNPVSLFIGGVTAVLLELAEPRVRDGVWQHSSFRTEPLKRLQRTGLAAMVTVYGARSTTEAMIRGIVRRHDVVHGTTSEGQAYQANDPLLLNWVQATATFGFMQAYHTYVRPLSSEERDRLLAEATVAAGLYGATEAPRNQAELDLFFEVMRPRLVPSPVIVEFLSIMENVEALPTMARPLQRALVKAGIALLPAWVRARLDLTAAQWQLSTLERSMVGAAARGADRLILPSSPPIQACRRLGLPEDYLFR
ncbi:oxygenase MpaB family protein [Rhizobium sp. SL42]|uniref:oxygenase MpaB family protein n=1 Tax=Rhizobium sp. SL42 TaxID=2806346 RepID=UPI001F2FAA6E|nr:oxygenase MpaB family protein [Rhizobium sp. SL42]UJW74295.1 DUF2236 domain-containing protein [Rhizobium sp. SL42]